MLPNINETTYTALTVPSTGKVFNFRPYLVAEEKVLLLAMESSSETTILDAIKRTLMSCCQETLIVDKLALFDFEYLFAQIRAQSVGQVSTIQMSCDQIKEDGESCDAYTEVEVDVSAIEIDVDLSATAIELTPTHTLTMRWPSYADAVRISSSQTAPGGASQVEEMFDLVSRCLVSVRSEDEIYDFTEESSEDIALWLNSLNSEQLQKLFTFINDAPKMSHAIEYKCSSCGTQQTAMLEGLTDFF